MISLKPYRRAAVPLLAIQTADPAEIVRLAIKEATNGITCPAMAWDCIHGVYPLNQEAQGIVTDMLGEGSPDPAMASGSPAEFLRMVEKIKSNDNATKAIIVAMGLADFLSDATTGAVVRQAVWNLRDTLVQQGAILVMTVPMGWRNCFPDDIAVMISPLPTRDELEQIAAKICKDAKIKEPNAKDLVRIGDALLGLSAFAAEQTVALSLNKDGVCIDTLWERKRQQISETPGLSVYSGKETFEDLGGLDQAKKLFSALLKGKRKPGAVVFIDEGEKALAGSQSDTSGVAQDQLGCLLSYMQDQNATGTIFVGPPGAAKSAFAKAIGNEGDIPTVTLDFGGMKGSLVGESEGRMRTALSVITAISGGRPFFVMTCNGISNLPPELKRRFTVGIMFFDLPSKEERDIIWPIYVKKYNLGKQKLPSCEGWTGAEIRQCADMADRLNMSLIEASKFIVPVSVSAKEKVETLRKESHGRYLSASYEGVYHCNMTKISSNRNMNLD